MLSREMAAALRNDDFKPVWLASFERAGDPLYVWSGEPVLSYDSADWVGTGALFDMSTIDKGDALAYREQQFSLNGIPPSALAPMDEDVSGREARLWLGMISPYGDVVRSPLLIHFMKQNFMKRNIGDDGRVKLSVSCTIALPRFDQASGRKWSHEAQQQRFAGDTGLYYLFKAASVGMNGLDWRPA